MMYNIDLIFGKPDIKVLSKKYNIPEEDILSTIFDSISSLIKKGTQFGYYGTGKVYWDDMSYSSQEEILNSLMNKFSIKEDEFITFQYYLSNLTFEISLK